MGEPDFDAFFTSTWRPLLLQTFAVCGDVGVAREALASAYVDIWTRWSRLPAERREGQVRSRAWNGALVRSQALAFQRQQGLNDVQRQVLRGLGSLPLQTRKAIALAGLSELTLRQIARQIGETPDRAEQHVREGLTAMARSMKVEPDEVAERMEGLVGLARAAAQPVAEDLRRQGRRRRYGHHIVGAATAVALTVAAGLLTYAGPPATAGLPSLGPALGRGLLQTSFGLDRSLGTRPPGWVEGTTDDNTSGSGINTPCQESRFADPQGTKALVRRFQTRGMRLVQTIEVSRTAQQADRAYRTVLGWYAGCASGGVQLLSAYDVRGLGDGAELMRFRTAGQQVGGFAVVLARSGTLTTWSAISIPRGVAPGRTALLALAQDSVYRLCASRVSGPCRLQPRVSEVALPPTGEQPGMLAVADIPLFPRITRPWVGTRAAPARANPAATPCDQTSFPNAGATTGLTRTFLIPGAQLPTSFGLSETFGQFSTRAQASRLRERIGAKMEDCPRRALSAKIRESGTGPGFSYWKLTSQVRDHTSVTFWMGIVQVGSYVAQVGFVPSDGPRAADFDRATFAALVARARDRLQELAS